jgi:tripartite-type tricarboxylate transporter receptor subunit TctC
MVPTLKEIGIDMAISAPYGIAGPKDMEPKIVKILHDAFKKGMEDPSYAAVLALLDQEALYLDSKDYRDYAVQQAIEQKRLIEELGLKQD